MNIIKYFLLALLIFILIKIIYDEKKYREYYDNVTKAKFEMQMIDINDLIKQEENKNNPSKHNFMNLNNLTVTNKLKTPSIKIYNSIKFNKHNLTIIDGELIIKDNDDKIIWTSKHLYDANLYDLSGNYAFCIMNNISPNKLPSPSTNLFYTKKSDNKNEWVKIKNIAFNGNLLSNDGSYRLNIKKDLWYNKPGIELIDIYMPQLKKVEMGIKSGKLFNKNCYTIPAGTTLNENYLKKNKENIEDLKERCYRIDNDTVYNNLIYGCTIYYINPDTIEDIKNDNNDDEKDVEEQVYPFIIDIYIKPYPMWNRVISLGMPEFDQIMSCEIYKKLKIAIEWIEGTGATAVHWVKNVGEDAYGWSYDQGGKAISWIKNDVGEAVVDTANTAIRKISGGLDTAIGGLDDFFSGSLF